MATAEERLAKIKEKQAQLKAQEKKIITQEKAKERKLRTKRLIEASMVNLMLLVKILIAYFRPGCSQLVELLNLSLDDLFKMMIYRNSLTF